MVLFEWDDNKNQINVLKHGYDFKRASTIYNNPDKLTFVSQNSGSDVIRFTDIAEINRKYLTLIYTIRGNVIRVMSLRPSSRKERKKYNET